MRYCISLLCLLALSLASYAQQLSQADIRQVRKETRKFEKEGWKVMPGPLSLYDQLCRSRAVETETDIDGNPKWQIGSATSTGRFYDAARLHAMTLAKAELAGLITTCLTQKIMARAENARIPQKQAERKARTIMEAKAVIVDMKISNPRILLDAYRTLSNGNVMVTLRIAIPQEKIAAIADELLKELKN